MTAEAHWFMAPVMWTKKLSFVANTDAEGGMGKMPIVSDQQPILQELPPWSGMRDHGTHSTPHGEPSQRGKSP